MRRRGIEVFFPLDAAATGWLKERVRPDSFQNIVLELGLLPYVRDVHRSHKDFLFFACRMLMKYADSPYRVLHGFRGVWRRTASFAAARRSAPDDAVTLLDEGTVHSAHYLFGQVKKEPEKRDLEMFWRLAPKPDLVVYLRASLDILALRMQARNDPPRRRLSTEDRFKFLHHAEESFVYMRTLSGKEDQWIIVDDESEHGEQAAPSLVDTVEAMLKKRRNAQRAF